MHDYSHRDSTLYLFSYATWQVHLYLNERNIHGAIRFTLPWMRFKSQSLIKFKAAISPKISNSIETLLIKTRYLNKSITLNPVNVHN